MSDFSVDVKKAQAGAKQNSLAGVIDRFKVSILGKGKKNPIHENYIAMMKDLGYRLKDKMWRKPGPDGEVLVQHGMDPPERQEYLKRLKEGR